MYGNITSHLYVFEEPLAFIEIPQPPLKGQRTWWPGNARHLARVAASEDKLAVFHGGPRGWGAAPPGPWRAARGRELTRHHPKLALGQQPGPGVAPRQWPLSICPPTSVPNWGQVVPSLPSSCSARDADNQGLIARATEDPPSPRKAGHRSLCHHAGEAGTGSTQAGQLPGWQSLINHN